MNSVMKGLIALGAGVVLVGCSNYGTEPMGMAVDEMTMAQTHDPYAADNPKPLRLDGEKAEKVISGYRGVAESAPGVQGDIQINIGN